MIKLIVAKRIFKFGLVGGTGGLIQLGIMRILVGNMHLQYLIGLLPAFTIAVIWNYTWNSRWTFQRAGTGVSRYWVTSLISLGVQSVALTALTSLGLNYILATAVGILLGFIVNLVLGIRFIWVSKKPQVGEADS